MFPRSPLEIMKMEGLETNPTRPGDEYRHLAKQLSLTKPVKQYGRLELGLFERLTVSLVGKMGEEGSSDSGDPEYHRVFAALDELDLSDLRSLFTEKHFRDKTLSFIRSEEELKLILKEELGLPFGQRFEFSRLWFENYHGKEAPRGNQRKKGSKAEPSVQEPKEDEKQPTAVSSRTVTEVVGPKDDQNKKGKNGQESTPHTAAQSQEEIVISTRGRNNEKKENLKESPRDQNKELVGRQSDELEKTELDQPKAVTRNSNLELDLALPELDIGSGDDAGSFSDEKTWNRGFPSVDLRISTEENLARSVKINEEKHRNQEETRKIEKGNNETSQKDREISERGEENTHQSSSNDKTEKKNNKARKGAESSILTGEETKERPNFSEAPTENQGKRELKQDTRVQEPQEDEKRSRDVPSKALVTKVDDHNKKRMDGQEAAVLPSAPSQEERRVILSRGKNDVKKENLNEISTIPWDQNKDLAGKKSDKNTELDRPKALERNSNLEQDLALPKLEVGCFSDEKTLNGGVPSGDDDSNATEFLKSADVDDLRISTGESLARSLKINEENKHRNEEETRKIKKGNNETSQKDKMPPTGEEDTQQSSSDNKTKKKKNKKASKGAESSIQTVEDKKERPSFSEANNTEKASKSESDLHDIRGRVECTETESEWAKTGAVTGRLVDQRAEESESKVLNQQSSTESKPKKKKKNKPTKESEESAQKISWGDDEMKAGVSSTEGEALAAVSYLAEQEETMLVKGNMTDTLPLSREAVVPSNEKTAGRPSQVNTASDTGNLALQNAHQTLNKACKSKGTQNAVSITKHEGEHPMDVVRCTPRPRGAPGRKISYERGSVLDAEENRELEFKSLVSAPSCSLPWKIMEKAKKFICACLNADRQGIIYFGVGDSLEKGSKYHHGEIIGLDVEQMRDDINKAFQFVLDDHIKSDAGPLQKGGEQNCVSIYFVPVKSQGSRTRSFVIEIEVARDWRFCRDRVYYSKSWIEKRGVDRECAEKRALSDFFKVKDEFDDVAIRTNGASTSVKPCDSESQVKKHLEVKYKDWRKKTKQGTYELPEELTFDDADAKRFSDVLRERLRELNVKEYGFILIANKLPAKYRGTAHLSFLQNIPWVAVFDLFDPSSKQDGLHHACNETSDAPRAKVRTLDEFKELTPDKDQSLISTRGTTWIFNNEEMQKGDWITCSKDCMYRALSAYKQCFRPGNLICVFLCLSETAVNEMADIMESSFSILGNSARRSVTMLSESRLVGEAFIKASKFSLQKELGECSVTGISWSLLKEIVRELVGPSKFDESGATTKLPFFVGFKEILNKAINSWDDLELYCPYPRLPRLIEDIEKERDAFYKGGQVSQVNLFHHHSIPRSLEKELISKVENALKSLKKENIVDNYHVKIITVSYEPGSGATTLCRRILWSKKGDYRCAVVKAITSSTDYQIEKLQGIGYDEENINFSLPVLVLIDNFSESDVRLLTEHIMRRQTRCVLLTTLPVSTKTSNFEITLRKLDVEETTRVKDILINITGIDREKRREAEQVLEREKRFIWFGLELFGREYLNIKERLQNHIHNILGAFLGERLEEHQMMLEMCCFLNKYSDGSVILPNSVVLDFLYLMPSWDKQQCPAIQDIHEAFGGLLIEVQDEKHGYYGWRPAHSLVSEVVISRINVEETAILALEKVVHGKAYVVKFLKQQVFRLFLDRKRISDPVLLKEQAAYDADLENEVFGFYGRRTRYSPVIEEIMEKECSIRGAGAMKVLLTICERATQTEDKAYAWQQLARFMGYEMRTNDLEEQDELHERLYNAVKKESPVRPPMPQTGIDAAHVAVDIAISLQPSYTNHYSTKGVLYLLQLTDYKRPSLRSLSEAIQVCRKALEVYDKALATSKVPNHFSMIGKIQAIILLLEIIKNLPSFHSDDKKFMRYLKEGDAPPEVVEMLSFEERGFVQSLSSTILDTLNELFGSVKIKQTTTYDENEIRSLNNAKIRGSHLRRKFYEITGLDKTELSSEEYAIRLLSSPSQDLALNQQQVQDILYIKDETPYSAWSNLENSDVNMIYQLLKSLCLRGHGSHNDMLICSKACLHLNDKPPVDDLDKIVKKFVEKFPNSEWANLFFYMIHFPIPSGGLAPYTTQTKEAIKKCVSIVQEKAGLGFRKSGAEYFLGKGIGLNALVNSHEFQWLETKWKTKTQFWRGKEPSEKLERVKGQKEPGRKGIISYHGIQIHFDNTLYPNESKDDLWFYLGFTLAGPYAYDPVDNDTYASVSASLLTRSNEHSERLTYSSKLKNHSGIHSARRKDRSFPSQQPRATAVVEDSNDSDTGDLEFSHNKHEGPDWITVGGRFNPLIECKSDQNPRKESKSRWVANKEARSQDQWQTVERKTFKPTERREKTTEIKGKLVLGSKGVLTKYFDVQKETPDGKLHHGAFVLGTKKSEECRIHKPGCDTKVTDWCNYAHGWRGDTLQFVCTKCTEENKFFCKEKVAHKPYIWNLGPYLDSRGEIWKGENTRGLRRSWGSLERFDSPDISDFVVDWE